MVTYRSIPRAVRWEWDGYTARLRVIEAVRQLQGRCGARQLANVNVSLAVTGQPHHSASRIIFTKRTVLVRPGNPGRLGRKESAIKNLPLSGIRILAIEHLIAMPFGTQVLAELGAEVVDVEHVTLAQYDASLPWRVSNKAVTRSGLSSTGLIPKARRSSIDWLMKLVRSWRTFDQA